MKGYDLREVKVLSDQQLVLVRMDSAIEAEIQVVGAVMVYCRTSDCDWHLEVPSQNVVEWL